MAETEEKLYELIKKGEVDFSDPCWENIQESGKIIVGVQSYDKPEDWISFENMSRLVFPWILQLLSFELLNSQLRTFFLECSKLIQHTGAQQKKSWTIPGSQ